MTEEETEMRNAMLYSLWEESLNYNLKMRGR